MHIHSIKMKFNNMEFAIIIAIFTCWTIPTTANDVLQEFSYHVDDSVLSCQSNDLSLNFSNAIITRIGRDFISSPLIICLDLRNNSIKSIAEGAFNKLPKMTNLDLSDNILEDTNNLFAFGSHQTLKVLTLNRMTNTDDYYRSQYYYEQTTISVPSYPNLEILSVSGNYFTDFSYSYKISQNSSYISNEQTNVPFPKLKILDLSNNGISGSKFVDLLPGSLTHLYLQDNSINFLLPLDHADNLITLTLDNNKLKYMGDYPNYSNMPGLWLRGLKNLRYLSLFNNEINTIESNTFQDTMNLVHLNLSKNSINNLYTDFFANLLLLETLDLSSNKLKRAPEILRETNITNLFLHYNNISYLNDNAFAYTPKLKLLSLGRNQINSINVDAFSYLRYLEELDLSNNQLASLPKGWCRDFESLEYLNLNHNRFISLESLSLINTLPLTTIYLAMNRLEYLDAISFNDLPQNVTINLLNECNCDVPTSDRITNYDGF